MVLVAPTKLKEEPILEAIEFTFGKNVRIAGGTPGGSNVIANDRVVKNGFALAVIYADTKVGVGFHAGIAVDNSKSGVVTAMGATRRIIKEINNKPAFEIYRKWAEGALDDVNPAESQAIWSRSFALVRVYNLAGNEVGEKVDLGARFILTSPIFTPTVLELFMEGIERFKIPILTSVLLLKSAGMANYMNKNVLGISIPDEVVKRLLKSSDRGRTSVEIAAELIMRLKNLCQGINILPVGWESKVPALLDQIKA